LKLFTGYTDSGWNFFRPSCCALKMLKTASNTSIENWSREELMSSAESKTFSSWQKFAGSFSYAYPYRLKTKTHINS